MFITWNKKNLVQLLICFLLIILINERKYENLFQKKIC
jgi:hypothetical protein